jgi:hypothetical protein
MRGALALLLVALIASHASWATTYKPTSIAELKADSTLVIRGRIQSAKSEWNAERSFIHTDYGIEVLDVLGGHADIKSVAVRVDGGTVDKISQRSGDSLSFKVGDEAIFFLKQKDGVYVPQNAAQGVVLIVDGKLMPHPSLRGIEQVPLVEGMDLIRKLSHP